MQLEPPRELAAHDQNAPHEYDDGILPLLAILVGLGLWAIVMFYGLGGNIDVILPKTTGACLRIKHMKEALERTDSGLMFGLSGRDRLARTQFDHYRQEFDAQLSFEQGNITLPEGACRSPDIQLSRLSQARRRLLRASPGHGRVAQQLYFSALLPRFEEIKQLEEEILLLNQRNMEEMNQKALGNAASSARLMIAADSLSQ